MPATSSPSSSRFWGPVWLLLISTSTLYFLSSNEADNDLWVHLRVGLDILSAGAVPHADPYSYTAAASAWIDHEWLTHVLLAAVYRAAGSPGLLALKLAVGIATVALLSRLIARRAASVHVRGAVLILVIAVLARGFAIRPQIVTYFFVVVLLWLLDAYGRGRRAAAWGIGLMIVLWANVHGGVLVGIGIAVLCALWCLATERAAGVTLGAFTILGTVAATIANPYGPALAVYLWHELSAPHPITEWQPLALEPAQATFLMLAAAFAVTLPFTQRWRPRGWEIALSGLFLVAAVRQQRHTPLFALCVAPVLAETLNDLIERRNWTSAWGRLSFEAQVLIAIAMSGLAAAQAVTTVAGLARDGFAVVFDAREYPVGAVAYLRAAGADANLALPLEWGGYSLWHLGPRVKVSLDGRFATLYPPQVIEDNFAFFAERDSWRRLIDQYPTDLVLAPTNAPPPVSTDAAWRGAYRDMVATLFVRRGGRVDAQLPAANASDAPTAAARFP